MAPPIPAEESPLHHYRAPTILAPALLPVTPPLAPFPPLVPLVPLIPFLPRAPSASVVLRSSVLLLVVLPALFLARLPAVASSRSSFNSPPKAPGAAAQPERGRRLVADEPQVLATSVGQVSLLLQSRDVSRDRGVVASGETDPRRRNVSESVANVANVARIARVASTVRAAAVAGTTACDVTKGRWAADPSLPLYDAKSCPFIPKKFNCASNGRPDNTYEKWRWEVDGNRCTAPHPTGSTLCELLKHKRILYIGDSIMENMFSSLACMAHALLGAPEVTPGKVERSYSLHWSPCNVTLTLIWCVPSLVGGVLLVVRIAWRAVPCPVPIHLP
ncbi:unnamed protein product [Closterium sp. NIES-54]